MQSHKNLFVKIIIFLFLSCLIFITVGFALSNSSLDLEGRATIKPDGKIYISNVVVDGTLRNASASPTYTDTTIDFNLEFNNASIQNPNDFAANFIVTITNDSSYDYEYQGGAKFGAPEADPSSYSWKYTKTNSPDNYYIATNIK